MKAVSVSSAAISNAMRYSQTRMQVELVKAQKEMDSLRVADLGLALGARTAQSVTFHRDLDRLKGIVDSNALVTSRLSSTQAALANLSDIAQNLMSTLTTALSGDMAQTTARDGGIAALKSMVSILNTSVNGEYLFAGINTDTMPISDFSAGTDARQAFDQAFASHFGFLQGSPAAAALDAVDIQGFLDDPIFKDQFFGNDWDNWSKATDQTIISRIALNETTQSSVSANMDGVRKLAMASALVSNLFDANLNEDARKAVAQRAWEMAGEAVSDFGQVRAQTGIIEKRVADASERMNMQIDLFKRHILDLEGVDGYEAANRVNDLMAHLQTSLAITARMQQLRLLNFLT